jgi:hypothetical protein
MIHASLVFQLKCGFDIGQTEVNGSCRLLVHIEAYICFPRFLTRALATEVLDFSDEDDTAQAICPVCKDSKLDFLLFQFYIHHPQSSWEKAGVFLCVDMKSVLVCLNCFRVSKC